MNSTLQRVWRRRLIGLRSLLVLCLALALLVLQQIARAPASLEPLLWLAALLLPNLIALLLLSPVVFRLTREHFEKQKALGVE